MALKIEVVEDPPGTKVLKVAGEVDMDSSPELRDRILRELKKATVLKLDLSEVGYLDSSGVAVLIQGYKGAQKGSVDYRLLRPSQQVRSVIDLAQLDQLFRIEDGEGS